MESDAPESSKPDQGGGGDGSLQGRDADDVLTPDAIITPQDKLFPYDKGQTPAAEAVKRRRRWLPGGFRRGGTAQYTQREQERGRKR